MRARTHGFLGGILVEFDGVEKDSIHVSFTGVQLLPMSTVDIIDALVSSYS